MAITYAWRLDANKYAYILGPNNEKGYASNNPLSGDQLASVAKTANERFGEGATNGFTAYVEAFNAMKTAIAKKWSNENVENYDLLSADVYYNVDASTCADLRGVGIRGIHYLGVCDKNSWNPVYPSWNPNVEQYNTTEIAGKFSVYGIYMEDQYDDDGNLSKDPTPENIFAVYNGADGTDSKGNFGTDKLQEMIEAERVRSTTADNEHNAAITNLNKRVDGLSGIGDINLSTLIPQIEELSKICLSGDTSLLSRVQVLENQVAELIEFMNQCKNPTTGTDTGTTNGNASISYNQLENGDYGIVVTQFNTNNLYYVEDVKIKKNDQNISIHAPSFYEDEQ